MMEILRGRVESGENDASKWLWLFNPEYSRRLGMPVFPNSLNLRLGRPFDRLAFRYRPHIITFGREEYGGERDILLLPCALLTCGRRPAFLWRPIHPTFGVVGEADVVEIVADVKLRDAYRLTDGSIVEAELGLELFAAGARQPVELGALVVVGDAPLGRDPALSALRMSMSSVPGRSFASGLGLATS